MRKLSILYLIGLLAIGNLYGQANDPAGENARVITFRFVPGNDMFYIPWAGNDTELERLCELIEAHRSAITSGAMPVRVDGYCTSLPTVKENLNTAFVRANRVKSELITRKGLKEADFITGNYATPYQNVKDIVVVTLRLPAKKEPQPTKTAEEKPRPTQTAEEKPRQQEPPVKTEPRPEPTTEKETKPVTEQTEALPEAGQKSGTPASSYTLALRTNLLYDALLLPTLGLEWRINRNFGVRIDGSLAHWGGATGKVQKVWLLNPEVRRYLLADRRFYVGVAASYGEYNLYKYPLGSLFSGDTGYQGHLWGAALTVGYQLPLCRCLAFDFNLGLGYARSEYDSFTLTDGARVIRQRGKSKNLFGPTQAGVHLVWTIGGNK